MQITIIAWLSEFLGFFIAFLGIFILGQENGIRTFSLQLLTIIINFIIVPSVFLINSNHVKTLIVDSKMYITIVGMLNRKPFS